MFFYLKCYLAINLTKSADYSKAQDILVYILKRIGIELRIFNYILFTTQTLLLIMLLMYCIELYFVYLVYAYSAGGKAFLHMFFLPKNEIKSFIYL